MCSWRYVVALEMVASYKRMYESLCILTNSRGSENDFGADLISVTKKSDFISATVIGSRIKKPKLVQNNKQYNTIQQYSKNLSSL